MADSVALAQARIAEAELARKAKEEREAAAATEAERARQALEERARQVGGVAINGLIWATRNVGAKGQFVSSPTDYGNVYTFEEAKTVCPAGWRLPTRKEFVTLVNSGDKWITEGGVEGYRFGNGGNTIFLPAAGYGEPYSNGTYYMYRSPNGKYWSSNAYSDTRGYILGFYSTMYVNPSYDGDYTYGHSVRCVRQ